MPLPFLDLPAPPAYPYRGLHLEGAWGPDLMELEDWCHLVDELAALGLNTLGVGVYGTAPGPPPGDARSDFLLVPFPDHPRLETPRTVTWYSPGAGAESQLTGRPRMFDGDFLGRLVTYGRERGVAVRPHFGGPGGVTLIPTAYPEVSARDGSGRPTGRGYCLTAGATYSLLFELYGSLIRRHLRPNGGVWWQLGLEGVTDGGTDGVTGDAWCLCPACAGQSPARLLVGFAVRCVGFLAGEGIEQVTLWGDALAALRALPLFQAELAEGGLAGRVTVQWRGGDLPAPWDQARDLRAWVTSVAGAGPARFHHEDGAAVAALARAGAAAGATGLESYGVYDPARFRSYAALAALAGRPERPPSRDRAAFTGWLFEGQPEPPAFEHGAGLFDATAGPLGTLLDALLPRWWGDARPPSPDVADDTRYPGRQIAQLAAGPLRLGPALAAAQGQAAALRLACSDAAGRAPDGRRRDLLEQYAAEAHKIEGVLAACRGAAGAWSHHRAARLAPTRYESVVALTRCRAALQTARQALDEAMAHLEARKAPYLRPYVLRQLTPLHAWLTTTHDRVREWHGQVQAGGLDDIPPLE